MKIEHIAIWTNDLEKMKDFYMTYFNMKCGDKYENKSEKFSSYFLFFENSKTKIELMHKPNILGSNEDNLNSFGLTHFAISIGNKEKVDQLTELLRSDGYKVVREARTTGDGYYESVIIDVEGNQVEITV